MEKEKTELVHWYYSVSEWEAFVKREKQRRMSDVLIEFLFVWMLLFLFFYLGRVQNWLFALAVSGNIAIVYLVVKYYIGKLSLKWKGSKMPEIRISGGTATINGKPTVFQGNGNWLRKVDIRERYNMNVLEITYERLAENAECFAELRIPVPKGKLREAMELLDFLNLKKDTLRALSQN